MWKSYCSPAITGAINVAWRHSGYWIQETSSGSGTVRDMTSTSQLAAKPSPPLHFRVSAGLKRIIGRDLIVSDFVAVFELVKNSFDARAKRVQIVVDDGCIWVIDNGKGMSTDDLINKWLFVAYSAKRDGTEDSDYRGHIGGKSYAGNKGVGRFSCDRLGAQLTLQTRMSKTGPVETLLVNWDRFERDAKEDFIKIPVASSRASVFALPSCAGDIGRGTVLKIASLRDDWDREKILDLRSHLTKLINPFDEKNASFSIDLLAPQELEGDEVQRRKLGPASAEEVPAVLRKIVNGPVQNFIFSDLAAKTTQIEVGFSDGGKLTTKLVDRGVLIYSIEEPNPYKHLAKSQFSCRIFYLNQAAKQTFARRMGVASVQFGSIFLFRNGFRVFPIGEIDDDTFGIDRRKQQGHARFLGTRELIGRIDVHGGEDLFREATSRDQGLIETPAYRELHNCFRDKCIKRLESYVVGVTWKDALDKTREDASGLMSAPARARIIELVSALVSAKNIRVIAYNREIVNLLSDKVAQFEESLSDLKQLARSVGDKYLVKRINEAEKRYKELREAEERAREAAEREKLAREKAEREAAEARQSASEARSQHAHAETALEEEKKRSTFLAALTSLDLDTITNLHHQITICSADIHELIEAQIEKLQRKEKIDPESLFGFLEQMRLKNQRVLAIARLATKANFRLESDEIEGDIVAYLVDHLSTVTPLYLERIKVDVVDPGRAFERPFKPIEMSIVIDNLVVNARKAGARKIAVQFEWVSAAILKVRFSDNGAGLAQGIASPGRLFEKGFSTTDGSGLGLYHVKQIIESMGGTIQFVKSDQPGAVFEITLPKS